MRYSMTMLVAVMVLASCAAGTKSYRCPDGTYVVNPASAPPDCPTGIFNPRSGDALGDTSTNSLSNLTQTGGTAYSCVYLATATEPTCSQIIAGTDGDSAACVDTSSKSAASTSLEFNSTDNHTGLTASTNYKVSHCVVRNGKKSRAQASASFSTLAGGGAGGADLTGTVYVVDSVNGNDANNGLSVATAWKTIAKVNSTVATIGADVCLMAGSVFADQQLNLGFGGTSSDQSIIGTCYESAEALYWWWEGPTPRATTRAKIDGTHESTCRNVNPMSCPIDTGSAVPSSRFAGLVNVNGAEHVTIRALNIQDSSGVGINVSGTAIGGDMDGIEIIQNEIGYSAFQAIIVARGARQAVVLDNYAHDFADCERAEKLGWTITYASGNCGVTSGQPAGVYIANNAGLDISGDSRSHSVVALNRFENGSSEILNISNSRGVYATMNVLGGGGATTYVAGDYNLLVGNIIFGNPDGSPPDNGQQGLGGVNLETLNREDQVITGENLALNNLVIGAAWGCWGGNAQSYALAHKMGLYCYFNSVLGPESAGIRQGGQSGNWNQLYARGNAFALMGATPCTTYAGKVTAADNAWDAAPSGDCSDAGDYVGTLGMSQANSYYETFEIEDLSGAMPWSNFTPSNGTELVDTFAFSSGIADILDDTEWAAPLAKLAALKTAGTVNTDHWSACTGALPTSPVAQDIQCTARGAAPFDAGAIEQ